MYVTRLNLVLDIAAVVGDRAVSVGHFDQIRIRRCYGYILGMDHPSDVDFLGGRVGGSRRG